MNIPSWWQFTLLSLAAFRVFRLISEDTILDRPRAWLLGYSGWKEGEKLPDSYRVKWGEWITCPWCLGFHLSVILWLLWLWQPTWMVGLCTPFALSAMVGLIAHFSDK